MILKWVNVEYPKKIYYLIGNKSISMECHSNDIGGSTTAKGCNPHDLSNRQHTIGLSKT